MPVCSYIYLSLSPLWSLGFCGPSFGGPADLRIRSDAAEPAAMSCVALRPPHEHISSRLATQEDEGLFKAEVVNEFDFTLALPGACILLLLIVIKTSRARALSLSQRRSLPSSSSSSSSCVPWLQSVPKKRDPTSPKPGDTM